MGIDLYCIALLILVPIVALVAGRDFIFRAFGRGCTREKTMTGWQSDEDARRFRRTFLQVYLLVMGSEWLQGPFMYSLFRDEKGLDQSTVATLYISTYSAAAISAFFTGYVTDRLGRRTACLAFCAIHSLSSISVSFDKIEILIAGRILGGIGLTLLWTAFESWMIAEYNTRGLSRSSLPLSSMFGIMTTSNCTTAILAGILGHCVVLAFGSKRDPFMIGVTWNENNGSTVPLTEPKDSHDVEFTEPRSHPGQRSISSLKDTRIWILTFVSCSFEGTIFLLTYFWPRTLREAHERRHDVHNGDAMPYGVIFATFMASMVLGALLFNMVCCEADDFENEQKAVPHARRLLTPTRLLTLALLLSTLGYSITALVRDEVYLFVAFLLLEACNGIYVPSVAYHRSVIVNEAARARTYSLMNVPLCVFVVVALQTTSDSGGENRRVVFILCAFLLLTAAVVTAWKLDTDNEPVGFSRLSATVVELTVAMDLEVDNRPKSESDFD